MTFLLLISANAHASDLSADQPGEISADQPGELNSSQSGEISANQPGEISASQPGEINVHQRGEISTTKPGIDPALCNALVKHTPDADVAYQPGVDVQGNNVAPADLPGQPQIKLPDKYQFPVTVSIAKALNLSTTAFPSSDFGPGTEMAVGKITIEGDKVMFNGQPLSDTQQDNLAVLCLHPNGK
jgi:hypothetical protein